VDLTAIPDLRALGPFKFQNQKPWIRLHHRTGLDLGPNTGPKIFGLDGAPRPKGLESTALLHLSNLGQTSHFSSKFLGFGRDVKLKSIVVVTTTTINFILKIKSIFFYSYNIYF